MSSKLELQADFQSHRPTLFVGLGGAGASAVNRIAGILRRRDNWREIQNIYQFFVIDTDRAMIDECPHIPRARKFIISNFDKGIYVEEKRGKLSRSKTDVDPRVVQWVHDWYNFRGSQGAGAGQIRIESRLSLYNSIESTDLIKRIEDAISQTLHMTNTKVDTRVKSMNVFLYFSVAGGTGSGSNLMMAALIRHIVEQFGWSANVTGVCMLPTLFLPVIRNPRQRDDILANGYSAIKEIEHLMKLKVKADDPLKKESRDFIFHPFIETTKVTSSPYDFLYIIDTTSDLFVDQSFREVVADAVYLQMFSPIFAKKDSDYDNYEKNQKRLARGLYTTHYGSFGCSLLILPDKDILEYCSVRKTLDIFKFYMSGSFIASDGRIFNPENDDSFINAEPKEQEEMRDSAFCQFIDHEVILESRKKTGVRKFSLLKKNMGLNEECTHDLLVNLEKTVSEKLGKSDEGESDELEKLMDSSDNFEPWFQSEIINNVWKMEKKGISEEGDEDEFQSYKYFELRDQWEQVFHESLFIEIGKAYSKFQDVDYITPFVRTGEKSDYRRSVQDEVAELTKNVHKRLVDINREIDRVVDVYTQRYSTSGILSNMFAEANANIYEQRYFALAIEKELSSRKKALELLKSEYDPENTRSRIEKFVKESQDGLENLYKEAEKKITEVIGSTEVAKFENSWEENFASPLNNLANDYENSQRYSLLYSIYSIVLKTVQDYLSVIREFYNNSSAPINAIEKRCAGLLSEETEQAGEYIVNEEVLRDLGGKRLWGDYYDMKIKGKVGELSTDEIMVDVTSVFAASDIYTNTFDRASAIQDRLIHKCREKLRPHIVGALKTGKEKRGLLINEGLKLEAELKLLEYLKANGFWRSWEETYHQHLEFGASQVDLPKKVIELRKKIDQYSMNYLDLKLQKCLRNSQLLANLNTNDSEVVEFSCKQAMMAYDTAIYGKPEADNTSLHFPSIVSKMSPETSAVHWTGANTSNIVVFYTAILGVPLFCFRNIIGQCKEAYNRRVSERRWDRPDEGRQYPLHIDKNWEPDDPSVDRSRLPLSPDPDEAVDQQSKSSEDVVEFFELFIRLVHAGDIDYDPEKNCYQIQQGKLRNKNADSIILGKSPRESVISLLSAIPAHDVIRERCAEKDVPEINRKDVEQYRKMFTSQSQVDVWHDEEADLELESTIRLIDDLLLYYDEREELNKRRAKRAHFGLK